MALGVYVGSLSRYYAGERRRLSGQSEPRGAARSPPVGSSALTASIEVWRSILSESLGGAIGQPLAWDETPAAPCFSRPLGWAGLGALVLWAAYAEHPGLRRPAVLPEDWDDDAALSRSNVPGFRSRFSHLVRNVEVWLPNAFPFTFEGDDFEGRRVVFGSAPGLDEQLGRLNAATWRVDPGTLALWRTTPPPPDAGLEPWARHAFAVLLDLTGRAVRHGLPMRLDY